jgi:hypothetical protein
MTNSPIARRARIRRDISHLLWWQKNRLSRYLTASVTAAITAWMAKDAKTVPNPNWLE